MILEPETGSPLQAPDGRGTEKRGWSARGPGDLGPSSLYPGSSVPQPPLSPVFQSCLAGFCSPAQSDQTACCAEPGPLCPLTCWIKLSSRAWGASLTIAGISSSLSFLPLGAHTADFLPPPRVCMHSRAVAGKPCAQLLMALLLQVPSKLLQSVKAGLHNEIPLPCLEQLCPRFSAHIHFVATH